MDNGRDGKGARIEVRKLALGFATVYNVKAAPGPGNATAGRYILNYVKHTSAFGFCVTEEQLDKFKHDCAVRKIDLVFIDG